MLLAKIDLSQEKYRRWRKRIKLAPPNLVANFKRRTELLYGKSSQTREGKTSSLSDILRCKREILLHLLDINLLSDLLI